MADPKGFLKYKRELPKTRSCTERVNDYDEIYLDFGIEKTIKQASRCMDCGVPFCHSGCPLGNLIPDFNDAVYRKEWGLAYKILSSTNNFPEFTGRICPAPCEASCVLGINQPPVAIEHIEKTIVEYAFANGLVKPQIPKKRTGKTVAVVGSGPAGLAAAAQLNQAGHSVTVFERDDKIGGLLRYGIPDFKLEKWVIDRRQALLELEGIKFRVNANVGENVDPNKLMKTYDALVLCGGSTIPRELPIEGRDANGIHFAMDFLKQSNKRVSGNINFETDEIKATGKHVVVIGGGDTGADCVGTSNRQKATSVTQIELLAKPPLSRSKTTPWPMWPMMLRTSSSHEEGCNREWAILTKAFLKNDEGQLIGLKIVEVEWTKNKETGQFNFAEIENSERVIPCDLALLAIGYIHPQYEGMLEKLGVAIDDRGNVSDDKFQTNIAKIFAAGDMRRGQSLVVWAIAEGREAADRVDAYLKN
ncbi:MAG: glutamate synthase subunit beta [Bacteroidota bacterium]